MVVLVQDVATPRFENVKMAVLHEPTTDSTCLLIPPWVGHGFQALEDAVLCYLVSQEYDGQDEHNVRWDDVDLMIKWPIMPPILSERDR